MISSFKVVKETVGEGSGNVVETSDNWEVLALDVEVSGVKSV